MTFGSTCATTATGEVSATRAGAGALGSCAPSWTRSRSWTRTKARAHASAAACKEGRAMNELAQLEVAQEGGVVVARILGEVDISNADALRRKLMAAVPNSARSLLVDVSRVGHLDSSGVALLFELSEALARRQQALCVVAPPTALSARVLQITNLDHLVPMAATVDEGLSLLARKAGAGA